MAVDIESKQSSIHVEHSQNHPVRIGNSLRTEYPWAQYIPGFSPSRMIKARGRRMVAFILALAGCCIMFFGYDASVMSQVNSNPDYLRLMGTDKGTDRDSAAVGGIISVWFGGFGIGAVMAGSYSDRIGRLRTASVGIAWGVLGAALQASAYNITWMMFARVIGGIGCGHLNTIIPVWSSETADAGMRGAMVATQFTLALTGSTIVYWMEYGLTIHAGEVIAWRFPVAFQIVFLLIALVAIPFAPESPRYLASVGKIEEARLVLEHCRLDPDPAKIDQEVVEIQQAIEMEATASSEIGWWAMMTTTDRYHTRRRILLGAGIQIMQKLTGIDFIATYAPSMFGLSGFDSNKSNLLAGGNFFGYTASLALAIYLLDRVGRRKMMLFGSSAIAVVLFIGGGLTYLVLHSEDESQKAKYGAGVAVVLYVYTFLYGSAWLATAWCYPSEIFPMEYRSRGAALATVGFSLAGGAINMIVPYLIKAVEYWVFFIFALINMAMLIPIELFYIETKNRSLEELDRIFSTHVLQRKAEKAYRQDVSMKLEEDVVR